MHFDYTIGHISDIASLVCQSYYVCRNTACFEWNLHTQISGGDYVVSTTFSVITLWTLLFCSMTHYDITIGNGVARDIQTDVARMLIYYVLIHPIMIFLFS